MKKKSIIVNGQNLNLSQNGGAGRYALELHKRLIQQKESCEFIDYDLVLYGFKKIVNDNVSKLSFSKKLSFSQEVTALLKHGASRILPPIIFDKLQSVYSPYKSDLTAKIEPDYYNTMIFDEEIKNSSKVLLHDLTNYRTLKNIGRLSLSSNFVLTVTFLDIQDFYFPEYFRDEMLNMRRLLYSFYKDRADIFFAISEFTKQTMVDRLCIKPEKIMVTHLAADDITIIQPSIDVLAWVKSFKRFLIYPAKYWKHKNHDFLFRALGRRRKECEHAGLKVLLTGGFNQHDINNLKSIIYDNSVQEIVQILGFVTDEQLQALVRGAEYLIFPSLFEGFGMPILEAMMLGCPVISSNACSLPEVGGDAALYFDPKCEDEFVMLIDNVLKQNGIDRDLMIQKGKVNFQRFSWDKTYSETISVYNHILN